MISRYYFHKSFISTVLVITVAAVCICKRGKRKTYHVQSFKENKSMMDNGIMIRNLSYQPSKDMVLKQGDQITGFVNLIFAEVDTNENIQESLPSIYENPDDAENVARPDEKMDEEKESDKHHMFNVKLTEPNLLL